MYSKLIVVTERTENFFIFFHLTEPQVSDWLIGAAGGWEELQSSHHYLEAICSGNCGRITTGWPALGLIFIWPLQHLPAGHRPNSSPTMIDAWKPLMVKGNSQCQAALAIKYCCTWNSFMTTPVAAPLDVAHIGSQSVGTHSSEEGPYYRTWCGLEFWDYSTEPQYLNKTYTVIYVYINQLLLHKFVWQ